MIKTGSICTSERTAVTATVIESGSINLGEPITQCGGTATLDAGSGFNSYNWSNGQHTQAITVSQSGTYTVTASNGACEVEGSVVVTINPVPSVAITTNGNTLTANATAGVGNYNYIWSTNEQTQSINVTADDNYCVTATDTNGCSASDCANIAMPEINISIADTENGSITGANSVNYNGNYTFTVIPDDCYEIGIVTVNGNEVILNANNSYTIQNVTTEQTINATFNRISYTITANAGNGGTINPIGNVNVNCGENKTFAIAANEGYIISDVLVDGQSVGSQSSFSFTNVDANHSISATFEVIPAGEIVIVVNTDPEGGSVSPTGAQTISEGNDFTFTVTPDNCYEIGSVTVNGTAVTLDANNSYTIENVTEPQNINVTFNPITYIITASAGNGGTITPSGDIEVNCGESKTFAIEANEGYEIADVTVDGQNVGAVENYTFSNVTENGHSIYASFNEIAIVPICYSVTNLTIEPNAYNTDGNLLSWTAAENADSYSVYRNGILVSTNTETIYFDIEGGQNIEYYVVTNCGPNNFSEPSETVVSPVTEQCNTISDLEVSVESYGNLISWTAAENAISYEVYRNGERIATETNTSSIDMQGQVGDSYYIITNCENGGSSNASETVTAEAEAICNTVTNLTAQVEPYGVVLSWNAAENATSYEIYRNGNWISTETNSSTIDLQGHEGNAYYIITNCANGSTSEASETVTAIVTGIDETENNIDIYPNPANDILNITSSEIISSVEIVNIIGQVVYSLDVNNDNAICNVRYLPNGVYVVRIHTSSTSSLQQTQGTVVVQRKFVKE